MGILLDPDYWEQGEPEPIGYCGECSWFNSKLDVCEVHIKPTSPDWPIYDGQCFWFEQEKRRKK